MRWWKPKTRGVKRWATSHSSGSRSCAARRSNSSANGAPAPVRWGRRASPALCAALAVRLQWLQGRCGARLNEDQELSRRVRKPCARERAEGARERARPGGDEHADAHGAKRSGRTPLSVLFVRGGGPLHSSSFSSSCSFCPSSSSFSSFSTTHSYCCCCRRRCSERGLGLTLQLERHHRLHHPAASQCVRARACARHQCSLQQMLPRWQRR